ncbi:MAG: sulfurtransferase-like selenium metabolism protein YedF, partial [Synergistaceae bacterium]|nr:sulfurtransferase-like selenium metabolism protein YedF [Synergistaceae bacterium]
GRMTLFGSVKAQAQDKHEPQNFSEHEPQKFLEQTQAPREKFFEREQPQNNFETVPQKFLEQNNFQQAYIKEEEDFKNLNNNKEVQELNLKVKQALAEKEQELKPESGGVFLIMGKTLGRGDDKLGGILIKGFFAGLARAEPAPESIILLNDGVKLALFDSSTCDHLKDLEARGTQILISGVCTSHFGITDSIGAGVIANIYEIVDVINKANKVVSL